MRVVQSHPFTRHGDPSPFPPNRISNTKYTLLTFIPLNLWQQCTQHMNRSGTTQQQQQQDSRQHGSPHGVMVADPFCLVLVCLTCA